MACSIVIPSVGEYLSGWYASDSFRNLILISRPVVCSVSPIASSESMSVTPTLLVL